MGKRTWSSLSVSLFACVPSCALCALSLSLRAESNKVALPGFEALHTHVCVSQHLALSRMERVWILVTGRAHIGRCID